MTVNAFEFVIVAISERVSIGLVQRSWTGCEGWGVLPSTGRSTFDIDYGFLATTTPIVGAPCLPPLSGTRVAASQR